MELTVQNVYGLLLRSKLMSPDEARAMFQRWQAEAGETSTSLPHFLRWLTVRNYLTEYQATLLGRGHADGFFLNQYRVLERLGKGRMAGVYKAQHELGQVVAIKVLPPSKARDPQFLGRFRREARLASRLNHPNIVRVFQVGVAGELNYFVMEYIEGETLDEVLRRRGKLPPTEAVRIVYLALLGLQHMHERGMVHRDLKPANLMLTPAPEPGPAETTLRSQVKILDIGLARSANDPGGELSTGEGPQESELTTEGVLLGTPDYMAPEQARDARAVDIRSDVYSLGCVLYHALAGQPPFPDTNLINQMIRHATEQARPLREFNPAVPDGLQQIVNWMMAKDPAQRYPTPERASKALQVFLAAGQPDAPPPAPPPDQKLKTYLDWVEAENSKADLELPPAPPPKQSSPPTTPAVKVGSGQQSGAKPAARAAEKAGPADSGARRAAKEPERKPQRKGEDRKPPKKGKRQAADVPVAAPVAAAAPAAAAPEFDVEVVAAPVARKRPPGEPFELTPRDFIMFGIGVGGTLLAIGGALLLVWLLSGKPAPTPTADTRPEQTAPE